MQDRIFIVICFIMNAFHNDAFKGKHYTFTNLSAHEPLLVRHQELPLPLPSFFSSHHHSVGRQVFYESGAHFLSKIRPFSGLVLQSSL